MNNIGTCVLCSKMFGFRVVENLQGEAEGLVYEENGATVLPVSLGSGLLLIGGQISGFSNPEVQQLIKQGCGININEFFGSRVCPICFPSSEDCDIDNSFDTDEDEDEDEYSYDEAQKPVQVLKVTADKGVSSFIIEGLDDMKEKSGIDEHFDSSYLRELGVYFWYDGVSHQKNLPLNVFCSVLAGSIVRGNVMIIGDINKNLRRTSYWHDLPQGWLDPRLAQVIEIINADQQIINMLTEALNN